MLTKSIAQFAAAENGAKKHPVDRILDEVKAEIPEGIDMIRKNPDKADFYLDISKKMKEMILNEVAETKEIPKTPELVGETAMELISTGAMVGCMDAALLLTLQKFPKCPDVGKEEGADGKKNMVDLSRSAERRSEDYFENGKKNMADLLQKLAEKLQEIAQKGAQSVLQGISDDARDVTTLLFDAAKLIPIGGEKVPVGTYQATLAGMVAGAYTAGLMDTGVAYLNLLTKETCETIPPRKLIKPV